jgi:hypothetical protein
MSDTVHTDLTRQAQTRTKQRVVNGALVKLHLPRQPNEAARQRETESNQDNQSRRHNAYFAPRNFY